mgnify:FL=1
MTGDNGGRPDMMYRIQRSLNRRELRRAIPLVLALGFMLGVASPALTQVDSEAVYRTPAPELAALVDAPATPGVSLSPDESVLLLMTRPGAPSIAEVSAPELRLASGDNSGPVPDP